MIEKIQSVADTYAIRERERIEHVNRELKMPVGGDVFLVIEREARQREDNAVYSGAHDGGGASLLRQQLRFYKYGRDGIFPPEWESFKRQAIREADPEWAELQRLKAKFGE